MKKPLIKFLTFWLISFSLILGSVNIPVQSSLTILGAGGGASAPANTFPTLSGTLLARWKANSEAYADTDAVTTFTDQSGNGRNLTPTALTEPEFKVNILNGKSVYRFHANLDSAKSASDWIDDTMATSFYAVVKLDAVPAGTTAIISSPNNLHWYGWLNSTTYRTWTNGSGNFEDNAGTNPTTAFALLVWIQNGITGTAGTLLIYRNNTLEVTTASRTRGAFDGFWLGCTPNSTVQGVDGDIAEAGVMEGAFSSTDRSNLQTYVNTEYGI